MSASHNYLHIRTMFISDVHLGTPDCQSGPLLALLRRIHCDKLYLVGDIIDVWRLQRQWFWTQEHSDVVEEILHKAHQGTEVIYIPGNHDEFLRRYIHFGIRLGETVHLRNHDIHRTADGRRLLVIHGDQFDGVARYGKWLRVLGSCSWELAILFNRMVNRIRQQMNMPYWSLSGFLKQHWKQAVQVIQNFETTLAAEAARRGLDGVVCGHIHHPNITSLDGIAYLNDGDWVESCTALVEHPDGSFELLFAHKIGIDAQQLVESSV
jgi:UDP-2,3-diacylglucosamine pyrophosphatase LpxH